MIRLTDEQWELIWAHFPEEKITERRAGRKPVPAYRLARFSKQLYGF
jgi:hypothetical protein